MYRSIIFYIDWLYIISIVGKFNKLVQDVKQRIIIFCERSYSLEFNSVVLIYLFILFLVRFPPFSDDRHVYNEPFFPLRRDGNVFQLQKHAFVYVSDCNCISLKHSHFMCSFS